MQVDTLSNLCIPACVTQSGRLVPYSIFDCLLPLPPAYYLNSKKNIIINIIIKASQFPAKLSKKKTKLHYFFIAQIKNIGID